MLECILYPVQYESVLQNAFVWIFTSHIVSTCLASTGTMWIDTAWFSGLFSWLQEVFVLCWCKTCRTLITRYGISQTRGNLTRCSLGLRRSCLWCPWRAQHLVGSPSPQSWSVQNGADKHRSLDIWKCRPCCPQPVCLRRGRPLQSKINSAQLKPRQ